MRQTKVTGLLALCALAAGDATVSLAATEVTGMVQELGGAAPDNGISGVLIAIRDKDNAVLASGTTDDTGRYRIALPASAVAKMMVFEKINFRARPTVRPITDPTKPQRSVFLIREGQPDAYYAGVWQQTISLGADQLDDAMVAISALDASERTRVLAHRDEPLPPGKLDLKKFEIRDPEEGKIRGGGDGITGGRDIEYADPPR